MRVGASLIAQGAWYASRVFGSLDQFPRSAAILTLQAQSALAKTATVTLVAYGELFPAGTLQRASACEVEL